MSHCQVVVAPRWQEVLVMVGEMRVGWAMGEMVGCMVCSEHLHICLCNCLTHPPTCHWNHLEHRIQELMVWCWTRRSMMSYTAAARRQGIHHQGCTCTCRRSSSCWCSKSAAGQRQSQAPDKPHHQSCRRIPHTPCSRCRSQRPQSCHMCCWSCQPGVQLSWCWIAILRVLLQSQTDSNQVLLTTQGFIMHVAI